MTIEKSTGGYWIISSIINGYRVVKKYLYYTKKEAIQKFKKEFKAE